MRINVFCIIFFKIIDKEINKPFDNLTEFEH